ncbi:MAG: hypothetical protein AABY22_32165 [Nanoarchaeota archaeon]
MITPICQNLQLSYIVSGTDALIDSIYYYFKSSDNNTYSVELDARDETVWLQHWWLEDSVFHIPANFNIFDTEIVIQKYNFYKIFS